MLGSKKTRKNTINILLLCAFFVGVGLVLYPSVSNWWNGLHSSRAVANYNSVIEDSSAEVLAQLRQEAQDYNDALAVKRTSFNLSDEQMSAYSQLLCVPDTNVMATLEIPSINVNLPIYHGTTESSLQIGIGHLAGSSLPIGGASTHTVLMGHRGLPSAKLLTELDKLKVGDEFCVTALGEEAWYQVDQILIVEPTDTSALAIEEGKDLCTLVTCTPYGVNSHRLLVRGHRVEAPNESLLVTSDAFRIDAVMVASILAIPVLLICIVVVFVRTYNQRYRVNLGDRFNE